MHIRSEMVCKCWAVFSGEWYHYITYWLLWCVPKSRVCKNFSCLQIPLTPNWHPLFISSFILLSSNYLEPHTTCYDPPAKSSLVIWLFSPSLTLLKPQCSPFCLTHMPVISRLGAFAIVIHSIWKTLSLDSTWLNPM